MSVAIALVVTVAIAATGLPEETQRVMVYVH